MTLNPKAEIDAYLTRPPDPVIGLIDVALGRYVSSPTTFYAERDNDRSGVLGILYPDSRTIMKSRSTTGTTVRGRDDDFQPFEATVVWDGARPSPISVEPIGWVDEEETQPLFKEHSKGLLLGDYPNSGALWQAVGVGRGMV